MLLGNGRVLSELRCRDYRRHRSGSSCTFLVMESWVRVSASTIAFGRDFHDLAYLPDDSLDRHRF